MALLARHVGNATIDDFVHLHFDAIRTLVVSPSPSVTVSAGGQESIGLHALDALGAPLAGRLSCQWEVNEGAPTIGFVGGSPTGGAATIMAAAQGGASGGSIHVVCGAASVDVPVTVTGGTTADAGSSVDAGGPVDADTADGGPLG